MLLNSLELKVLFQAKKDRLSILKTVQIIQTYPDMFELFGPFSKLIIDPFLPEIALSIPESLTTFDFFSTEVEFGPEALSEFFKNSKPNLQKPLKLVLPTKLSPE